MAMKTHAKFVEQIKNLPLIALSEYRGCRVRVKFRCMKCDHVWSSFPSSITKSGRRSGCPPCGMIRSKTGGSEKNDIIGAHDQWVVIDISTKKIPVAYMMVNESDWASYSGGRVYAKSDKGFRYITASCSSVAGKFFHHNIIPKKDGLSVDHISHTDLNVVDNRRSNLRSATTSQNCMNRRLAKNNTSGVVGVGKHGSKWVSYIKINQKMIHLGSFLLKKDAVDARACAEEKYFGEFSYKSNN